MDDAREGELRGRGKGRPSEEIKGYLKPRRQNLVEGLVHTRGTVE